MRKEQLKRLAIVLGSSIILGIVFYLSWLITPKNEFSETWIFAAIISLLVLFLVSFIFYTIFTWVKTGKLPERGSKKDYN